MKRANLLLFLAASVCSVYVSAQTAPTQVAAHFNKLYVPIGFDDNDNVQIVGEGVFPNSCYRQAETKVQIDATTKTVILAPTANKYDGMCLQVMLPYSHVIELGLLSQGVYTVLQDGKSIGKIDVRKSSVREPDDFMYAPIEQAYFHSQGSSNQVYLTGDFPTSCWRLKKVNFDIQPDVLVIQPIVEIDNSVPCTPGKFHFETATEMGSIPSGRYLLHVRSMNGKSVNNLVDVH